LRRAVEYPASDALEGRATGTDGARKAAAYITTQLKAAGLKPLGKGAEGYQKPFEFTAGVKSLPDQNHLTLSTNGSAGAFEVEKDFRPLSFTANSSFEGEVVFAGYGLSVPSGKGRSYNSYDGLDVSNKIVLVLRYVPEDVEPKRRQELNLYAGLRYKALMARQRGAKALLVVTGPNSPNAGALAPLTFDTSLSGSGIIAASVSDKVAAAILSAAGKDLKTLQTGLDSENPHAEGGFPVPKVKVKISTGVEQIKQSDNNIVAVLPPSSERGAPARRDNNSTAGNQRAELELRAPAEYLLVGAHYDHLGHGEGRSLERSGEEGQIHHGADDNASGVATILELAANLAAERAKNPAAFKRGIIFALWSGEEIGLIGSSHFADAPMLPLTNIIAYVNFDMVGRLRDDKLDLQGVGSSSVWRRLIEKRNVAAGFNVSLQDDPYLPTDVTAFYPKGLPVLHFFTGSHEDYHRPTDTADKLNYDGMERIAKFARGILLDLLAGERPDYLKVAKAETGGAGRDSLRAYLGTIPDYTQEVQGVKLSGVRGGGPAEKAGLKGGDIIVEFAGQKITNIYDYTYAMDSVKIGKPVEVVVLRDGQRVKITVVPEARK
ncbi:MAG: M28 family peptidase, partial [Verrucomicrobia bacterium]|nr:M28 family peptidase [Verrucomicrobiota bacterium]